MEITIVFKGFYRAEKPRNGLKHLINPNLEFSQFLLGFLFVFCKYFTGSPAVPEYFRVFAVVVSQKFPCVGVRRITRADVLF